MSALSSSQALYLRRKRKKTTDMEADKESTEKIHGQQISDNSALPLLALIPVLLTMMLRLKLESGFNKAENIRLKRENDAMKEEMEKNNEEIGRLRNCLHSPLLSLPDEIIGHILSFLPIKDRMIARVCKKLDEIESDFKHYVPRALVTQRATDDPERHDNHYITWHKQYFVLLNEKIYSTDFFKRIIANAKFGYLAINLPGTIDFHREIFNLVRNCEVYELVLSFWETPMEREKVDSFMLDLMQSCTKLELSRTSGMTAAGLHEIYTGITNRSAKLRSLNVRRTSFPLIIEFLDLLGIRLDQGNLISLRNIQAFKSKAQWVKFIRPGFDTVFECVNKHIFHGYLEMIFRYSDGMFYNISGRDVSPDEEFGSLKFILHETTEDLEKAKNREGLVRVEVFRE